MGWNDAYPPIAGGMAPAEEEQSVAEAGNAAFR